MGTVSGNCRSISYIQWECRKSDGRAVAPNLLENTHFSTEMGLKIMN
jgi:hypothetical protein